VARRIGCVDLELLGDFCRPSPWAWLHVVSEARPIWHECSKVRVLAARCNNRLARGTTEGRLESKESL